MIADRISQIEDLMIAALKAALPDVKVETRSVPLTEKDLTEILGVAPFVVIEYAGGARVSASEDSKMIVRRNEFNIFTAARSLRSKQDAQRGSYELLATTFNTLHTARLKDTDTGQAAGPFIWSSEAPIFVADVGTVYQSVYTLIEPTT